ncbi:MAG: tRNA lysidine(34) synthetase TilS [Bacteroidota bacterium]|nr:tRNA lysidine(34) synthetase TilS [Bacteroidota bacterium]
MSIPFHQKIANEIKRRSLMRHEGLYLVALSGGADSVALLRVLIVLEYKVEAVHCNFHLRGEESDRDENFCVSLCEQLGIKLHLVHFDTLGYASAHHVSIEMAARELRYGYFEQLRLALNAEDICVAHHQDDQVETVLLNLVRGTGLAGLQGMCPRNGHIIRPMLGMSRAEILVYLNSLDQSYVTDSTNLDNELQRNKLRLDVIPLLETINPAVKENIARMTDHLHEVTKVVEGSLRESTNIIQVDDNCYDLNVLSAQLSPEYLLWSIVSQYGFNSAQASEIMANRQSGAKWKSTHYVACVDRDRLYILPRKDWEEDLPEFRIPEIGTYQYPHVLNWGNEKEGHRDQTHFRFVTQFVDSKSDINKSHLTATLDADEVEFPLTLRPIHEGDRFVPFGMKGSKLVSDFLTDLKMPLPQRRRQLVLTDAHDNILWLVACRIDNRFALIKGHSTKALIITTE